MHIVFLKNIWNKGNRSLVTFSIFHFFFQSESQDFVFQTEQNFIEKEN